MKDPDLANAYHEARAQMNDFELRPGTGQDLPIVFSATAKSLRSSPLYRDLAADQWRDIVNGLVTRMTSAPWHLTIAHPTGYPSEVAGFLLHTATPTRGGP
jgi:predicted component of type VI protein secretion system